MTFIYDSRAVGIVVLLLLIFGGRVFGDSAGVSFSPSVMTSGRHNAWEDQTVVVSLVNGHAHAVRLVSLRSSCSCLRVETPPQDDLLPANGAVAIKAYLRGGTKTGSYTLYLFAEWQTANGDASGMTRLSIRGEAVPPLMVTSGGKQNLGTIPVGQTARCRITLRGGLVPVVLREPETASDMTLAMPKRRLAADEEMVVELMLTPQKTGAFQRTVLFGLDSYEIDALHLTVSMALVVSPKQPFLVVHFRREAAEALKARPKIAQGKRRRRRAQPWVARHSGPCSSASLAPVGEADWSQRGNGTH